VASIEELKSQIDLHDLAAKLGLERPQSKGNYRSPHHKDRNPSLSVYAGGTKWKDHSSDDGGDAIDLMMMVKGMAKGEAIRELHELYGIPLDPPRAVGAPRERTQAEWLADTCLENPEPAVEYLVGRGISEATVRIAIKRRAVGHSTWTSATTPAEQVGHGGPAVAFICRDMQTNQAMAVDKRFVDPHLNGDVKTQSHGEKAGFPWFIDRAAVASAQTVFIVESSINALCIESLSLPRTAAISVRGTGNVKNIDWRFMIGKRAILAFDADLPNARGERPGDQAAWHVYESLTALNVAAHLVDTASWYADEVCDVADIAKKFGLEDLRERMAQLEPWAIAGLPGKSTVGGRSRVFLPPHDFGLYWRYRVRPDFTSYVEKVEADDAGEGGETMKVADVAGFRVASLSRVSIASATATMTGEADAQPTSVFAVTVQVARHGNALQRRVLEDERLHNVDQWKKLGPIFHQQRFSRLLNIMERTADLGARDATNFVGLAWRDGRPIVNEGPDCFFTEPEKQCPYHNLTFPSGRQSDAKRVIHAYQATYGANAMMQTLAWSLGGHLKAFLGFWPHLVMQADKGSGKSTQIKRLERTIGFTMFSGQSLQTEFRLLTSISHTSHPVGWEELSARRQDVIDKAVGLLQENYQYTVTRRGSDMTEFLLSAPVLLAGEDVPVRSLTGKVVRCSLNTKLRGKLMPEDLPRFPVREWLLFLATLGRKQVMDLLDESEEWLRLACRAPADDNVAQRMVRNYATTLTSWSLLCEFAGIDRMTGNFPIDLRAEMNAHISETAADREPFVNILELLAEEIEAGEFHLPWKIEVIDGIPSLLVLPSHVMGHISKSPRLREHWNGLSVKSARVFSRQLDQSGLVVKAGVDKVIRGRRQSHMVAISLVKLSQLGVHLSVPEEDSGYYDLGLSAANG
jgi:hypothetical protein